MPTILDLAPQHAETARRVQGELERVERLLEDHSRSDLPPVDDLARHVERFRGKMLRPTMVVLCGIATAPEGVISLAHRTIAAVIEMIHLATLVHDDVLDDAQTRRKGRTINSLHGNEAAVILGDYLISKAFHLCSTLESQKYALRIGEVTNQVCEGELLQLSNREQYSLDEPTYFEIIRRKTASLIGVACELGASCSGADEGLARAMYDYGERLGVAFQIVDDLLDLTGDEAVVGKTLGKDLEKGKLTLPLIHLLASSPPESRGRALRLIESRSEHAVRNGDAERLALLELVRESGSLDYALSVAGRLVAEAKELATRLPESEARALMLDLADTVVSRRL